MDFIKLLGPESYKEGNFFYDLHEENIFNIEAYHKLIEDIRLYKVEITKDENINKEIISNIYLFMGLFIWTLHDYELGKYQIKNVNNYDEIYEYYSDLNTEILQLMSMS